MTDKLFSEYAERNGGPILGVLRDEFSCSEAVLEIGSGTGQHAVQFATALAHLQWQTSDRDENHDGINAWVDDAALENLLPPLSFDVLTADVAASSYDAVFSANTAHIMSIKAVEKMFTLVGQALMNGGIFCLYGPFRQGGEFNTASNAAFHASLRSRKPEMGIRHLEGLDELGRARDLERVRLYTMPANNQIVVWKNKAA
jgi:SAM-dependent methyltransferase